MIKILLNFAVALLLMQQAMSAAVCPINEVYQECGTFCPATCENYKEVGRMCTLQCVLGCFCISGFVRSSVDSKCYTPSKCPASVTTTTKAPQVSCPLNQQYSNCVNPCPLTCNNYKNPPQSCIEICRSGCECKKGYVKKTNGSCVLPSKC